MKLSILIKTVITATLAAATTTTTTAHRSKRIVGGVEAEIERFPYQVSVQYPFAFDRGYHVEHVCGGVLISPDHILTAAHCIINDNAFNRSKFFVRAGSSYWSSGGQLAMVADITTHPGYDPGRRSINDLAVLKLSHNLTLGTTVAVADLAGPQDDLPNQGTDVIVAGWGSTRRTETSAVTRLHSLATKIMGMTACVDKYRELGIQIGLDNLCAWGNAKTVWKGDSGSALYHIKSNKVIGVVSFGTHAQRKSFPTVYTAVSRLRDFIWRSAGV